MKVAFFLDNSHLSKIDFSEPEQGNPGTGAGTYLHAALPHFLNKYQGEKIEAVILAAHTDKLPSSVPSFQVDNVVAAASKAKEIGADFFVFRPRLSEEDHILDHIDRIKMPSIGRAALTPRADHLRKMACSKYFKALVCVGREQYDYLMDSRLKPKLAYIDNGINLDSCLAPDQTPEKDPLLVAYMGALVPMKGFHVLAAAWPKVLQKFPRARLSVIGSVKMYGEDEKVGPLGVAHESYEREHIMPYLCDAAGNLHPSVTFHGQMGKEKFDVLRRAIVGVANPTGKTETCCVSAVEMSGCKTAVVSGAYYALLDTVLHKKTGLLGRGVDQLADNICRCLANPEMAERFGKAGYERIKAQYDFSAVVPRWIDLFEGLNKGCISPPRGKLRNIFYHYKILRLGNTLLQSTIGKIMPWPSVFEIQVWIYDLLRALKSRVMPL